MNQHTPTEVEEIVETIWDSVRNWDDSTINNPELTECLGEIVEQAVTKAKEDEREDRDGYWLNLIADLVEKESIRTPEGKKQENEYNYALMNLWASLNKALTPKQ